jgi:hypothetical protein
MAECRNLLRSIIAGEQELVRILYTIFIAVYNECLIIVSLIDGILSEFRSRK